MTVKCDDRGQLVDDETGEIMDNDPFTCLQLNDLVEDHDLVHYSHLPPVPYVLPRVRENMRRKDKWLKRKDIEDLEKRWVATLKRLKVI